MSDGTSQVAGPISEEEAQQGEQNGRQTAPPAQPGDEPFVHWIERHSQHHTPDCDRDEWADENEGPIEQESEDAELNRQFDPSGREPIAARHIGVIG